MQLLCTRDRAWMRLCDATLLADQIEVQWVPGEGRGLYVLDVPTSDAERAATLLAGQLAEERQQEADRAGVEPCGVTAPLLLQPGFAFGVGLAGLTLAFFQMTGGSEQAGCWFQGGALLAQQVIEGRQWWRLVTAATLHADASHALGNAGFFLLLGWAGAERLGVGLTMLVWLATAVAGFASSLFFSDVDLTVGASGGLFGLLGAAAIVAVRASVARGPRLSLARRERWRAAGAGILLFAFTAFSARANIAAHAGGFGAGALLGGILPRRRAGMLSQVVAAAATVAMLVAAWALGKIGCAEP